MFTRRDTVEAIALKRIIADLMNDIQGTRPDDPEYAKMTKELKNLFKLLALCEPKRVSPDTMTIVAGNILIAVMVVGFERANVVTSKVFSFLMKALK